MATAATATPARNNPAAAKVRDGRGWRLGPIVGVSVHVGVDPVRRTSLVAGPRPSPVRPRWGSPAGHAPVPGSRNVSGGKGDGRREAAGSAGDQAGRDAVEEAADGAGASVAGAACSLDWLCATSRGSRPSRTAMALA